MGDNHLFLLKLVANDLNLVANDLNLVANVLYQNFITLPQLKRIALILENVSKLFVSNFIYVSLTN